MRRGKRPRAGLLFAAAAFCGAGFYAMRWESWAAVVAVVLAVDVLNVDEPSASAVAGRVRTPVLIGTLLPLLGAIILVAQPESHFTSWTPTDAFGLTARYAAGHPGATILADDISSDALLLEHPELAGRIAFDGRLEIYREGSVRGWAKFIRGRQEPSFLERYDVLVAAAPNRGLVAQVKALEGWRMLYSGSGGVVAARIS